MYQFRPCNNKLTTNEQVAIRNHVLNEGTYEHHLVNTTEQYARNRMQAVATITVASCYCYEPASLALLVMLDAGYCYV